MTTVEISRNSACTEHFDFCCVSGRHLTRVRLLRKGERIAGVLQLHVDKKQRAADRKNDLYVLLLDGEKRPQDRIFIKTDQFTVVDSPKVSSDVSDVPGDPDGRV